MSPILTRRPGAESQDDALLKEIGAAILAIFGLALLLPLAVLAALALPIIALVRWTEGKWLRWRFRQTHGQAGKFAVFVYSNSPHWKGRIEAEVLPRLEPYAVVLNWSERGTDRWLQRSLAVRIFRFWGGDRAFNPLAILIPPDRPVATVRFWDAYLKFKHGKPELLESKERELFTQVDDIAQRLGGRG